MTRGEIITAIDHDFDPSHGLIKQIAAQALADWDHPSLRVDLRKRDLRRSHFAQTDRALAMQNLALQVGRVDPVAIGDVQGANPRTGQIDRHGRAQATGPDDQNACLQQARLSLKPDLVEQQMARIAHQRRIIQE